MASLRKKPQPRGYRDGGAVHNDDVAPAPEASADVPPLPDAPDDALIHAVESDRRATELAQANTEQSVDKFIDQLPISPWKRAMLRIHPEMLEPSRAQMVRRAHDEAMAQGIPDDSMALYDFVTRRIAGNQDQERAAMPPARPAPMLPPEPQQPRRKSIPIAAPPTREVPNVRDGSRSEPNRTLSPAEREIAHISFPHLPRDQAEYQYFRNRQRMREMKARGELQE